jgi:hypothetical protein
MVHAGENSSHESAERGGGILVPSGTIGMLEICCCGCILAVIAAIVFLVPIKCFGLTPEWRRTKGEKW